MREDLSRELADWFVKDLKRSVKNLKKHHEVPSEEARPAGEGGKTFQKRSVLKTGPIC